MRKSFLWYRKLYSRYHYENRRRLFPKAIFLKIIVAFCMLIGGFSVSVFAEDRAGVLLFGRVVYVDQDLGFVVFNLGKQDGIIKDTLFEVYRRNIEVGRIKAVKVREKFSAADIELTYQNMDIKIGDTVRPSRKSAHIIERETRKIMPSELEELYNQAEEYFQEDNYEQAKRVLKQALRLDPQNEETLGMLKELEKAWLSQEVDEFLSQAQGYLNQAEWELAMEEVEQVLRIDPKNQQALELKRKIERNLKVIIAHQPKTLVMDINAPKQVIHSCAIGVFKEHGYVITFSDPLKYNLEAFKTDYFNPILQEWGPLTKSKIYYTVEIKDAEMSELLINRLVIRLRGAYDSEGSIQNYRVEEASAAYEEASEIILAIKTLAEQL